MSFNESGFVCLINADCGGLWAEGILPWCLAEGQGQHSLICSQSSETLDLIKVNYKAKHLQNTDRPHQKPRMSSSQKVLFSSNVFYFKSNIIGFI